jgi:GxxExxY protein
MRISAKSLSPAIQINYRGELIRTCKAKALGIANQILCGITAIQDKITLFDIKRMKTYLKYSDVPIGLLINFGKSNLEIKALLR